MLGGVRTIFVIGLSALVAASACSSDSDSGSTINAGGSNAGGSTSTGGSSGSGAAGSSGFSGVGGSLGGSVGTTGGAGGSGPVSCDGVLGDACATEQYAAEAQPVDIFIMLDQSTSMALNPSINDTIDEWTPVTNALKYFINLPQSSGLRVGIQYFGQPGGDATSQGESCNSADYATPDVPIGELPGNAAALIASIDGHDPSTFTPTYPALEGALMYARNWATTSGRLTVVVLATDGYPTVCNTDLNAIRNLAAQYATGTPRILTFVVGIGALPNLAGIAASGGTGEPFVIDTSNPTTAEQQFSQAMRSIAATPLSCDYAIPSGPSGGPVATSTVNLTFTPNLSACSVIRRVNTSGECGTVDRGWYFDNNTTPTRILICQDTCETMGAGVMEMRVGCPTVTGPR